MKKITPFFILLLIFGCQKQEKHDYGFYYWRTKLSLNQEEQQLLKQSKVTNLYTRFFDIDKTHLGFQALGIVEVSENFSPEKKIVPVVFITNRTWEKISEDEIAFLAKKLNESVNDIQQKNKLVLGNEIQIDSDWTVKTKDDYFKFLKKLKEISGKEITCTLRLHQVKDKTETGIPPVEKMYLMAYATSSPLENSEKNSILDVDVLKAYLKNLDDYPVKLDVALPIYSWGIVTNHLGKKKLINALTVEELAQNKNLKKLNETTFEVQKDDFYYGFYLNKKFTLKVEEIPEKDVAESLQFIDGKLNYNFSVVYYHLDSRFTGNYEKLFK